MDNIREFKVPVTWPPLVFSTRLDASCWSLDPGGNLRVGGSAALRPPAPLADLVLAPARSSA